MSILFRSAGTVLRPEAWVRRGGGLRLVECPTWCAVVERDDGLVLIDAGWSRAQCAFPDEEFGVTGWLRGLRLRAEDALASQIVSLGFDPNDVRHIVATSHRERSLAGARDFPNALLHVRGDAVPATLAMEATRTLPHPLEGRPAIGFAHADDLFGDGSILLLDPSSPRDDAMAVGVRLEEGWLVLAGTIASTIPPMQTERTEMQRWIDALRPGAARVRAALRAATRDHGARVVFAHDRTVTDALPTTREKALRCAWDSDRRRPNRTARAAATAGTSSAR